MCYLFLSTFGPVRHHSLVGHVEPHVGDGGFAQVLPAVAVGGVDIRLRHQVAQRLLPERQPLGAVHALQATAEYVSVRESITRKFVLYDFNITTLLRMLRVYSHRESALTHGRLTFQLQHSHQASASASTLTSKIKWVLDWFKNINAYYRCAHSFGVRLLRDSLSDALKNGWSSHS